MSLRTTPETRPPLTDKACLYAARLFSKGYTVRHLAQLTGRTREEIQEAFRRADEIEAGSQ